MTQSSEIEHLFEHIYCSASLTINSNYTDDNAFLLLESRHAN